MGSTVASRAFRVYRVVIGGVNTDDGFPWRGALDINEDASGGIRLQQIAFDRCGILLSRVSKAQRKRLLTAFHVTPAISNACFSCSLCVHCAAESL
jgi:hypothetical protein